jgi:hypothetical protein
VLKSCHREGSSDKNIKNSIPNDIDELLRKYPNIKTIFLMEKQPKNFLIALLVKILEILIFLLKLYLRQVRQIQIKLNKSLNSGRK